MDINLHAQSPDISMGVDAVEKNEEGAGDQGIMFGYATDETKELMPLPIQLSHELLRTIRDKRLKSEITGLGPDAKSQFSIIYENERPVGVRWLCFLYSIDSLKNDEISKLYCLSFNNVPDGWSPEDNIYINHRKFQVEPVEAGLTVEKVGDIMEVSAHMVEDLGKDPSKVDRSEHGTLYSKNLVASGIVKKCTLQLAYVIGIADQFLFF